jgi:hypothetical protein
MKTALLAAALVATLTATAPAYASYILLWQIPPETTTHQNPGYTYERCRAAAQELEQQGTAKPWCLPNTNEPTAEEIGRQALPIVNEQLAKAGVRLAVVLNPWLFCYVLATTSHAHGVVGVLNRCANAFAASSAAAPPAA